MTDNTLSRSPSGITYNIIYWTLLTLPLTAVIYGVTSWCIVAKFRHFRNYVLISASFANMFYLIVWFFMTYDKLFIITALFLCCLLSYNSWLLVLCYICYVDFVKVFKIDIRKKYLKSSLFGWGVPFTIFFLFYLFPLLLNVYGVIESTITAYITMVSVVILITIVIIVNFVLYILVVYSVFRGSDSGTDTDTSMKKWRQFFICTLVFGFSNVLTLSGLMALLEIKDLYVIILVNVGQFLNAIALNVYTILSKKNRKAWSEFLRKRQAEEEDSLEME